MKRLLVVLLMAFGLMIPAHSYAQTAPAPSGSVAPTNAMSPEDMAKMREQIQALSKALGNPDPAKPETPAKTDTPAATPAPADSAKPTSAAEVASKAIDMMGNGANKVVDMIGSAVGTLSTNLSKIAPQVWRIMIVQQYAKAIDGIVTPTLLLVLLGVVTIVLRKNIAPPAAWNQNWNDNDYPSFWFRTIIPTFFLCVFGVWFVADFGDSIKLLINPEFYAIKDILLLITNPSAASLQ
jgi:hypothetical protein